MNNDGGPAIVDDPIPTELRARALVRKTGKEDFSVGMLYIRQEP